MKRATIKSIKKEHIEKAAAIIDIEGIPQNEINSHDFFLELNDRRYPFKYITRKAYELANGCRFENFKSNKATRGYIATLGFQIIILSSNNKISRITWSTNRWVMPSGKEGKPKTGSGYEVKNGFGYEEWLFNGEMIIDGYKYGFLESVNKHYDKYSKEKCQFDISLYTRNDDEKQYFWVGTLKDVEIIDRDTAEWVLSEYKNRGWYDLMKTHLKNLNLQADLLDNFKPGKAPIFNIKFKWEQVSELPVDIIPIENKSDIPSNRYTLMNLPVSTRNRYEKPIKKKFSIDTGSDEHNAKYSAVRRMPSREIEVAMMHHKLQNKFLDYLKKQYPNYKSRRECRVCEASRIDAVMQTEKGYVFYEIKTYNNLRTSIREAIGQLLEYCFYPQNEEAYKLIVVSHIKPNDELRTYIKHLKKYIKIEFGYIYFDMDNDIVAEEI